MISRSPRLASRTAQVIGCAALVALSACSRGKGESRTSPPAKPEAPVATAPTAAPGGNESPNGNSGGDGTQPGGASGDIGSTGSSGMGGTTSATPPAAGTRLNLKVSLGSVTTHQLLLSWEDVSPILNASCVSCHGANGISPKLHSWEALGADAGARRATLERALQTIRAGTMPPPVVRDRVDASELERLQIWTQNGAPLGHAETMNPAAGYSLRVTWTDGSSTVFTLDEHGAATLNVAATTLSSASSSNISFTWQLLDQRGEPASEPALVQSPYNAGATQQGVTLQLSTQLRTTPPAPEEPEPTPSPVPVPVDTMPPSFVTAPVASEMTDRSVRLSWDAAIDGVTASDDLEYQVLAGENSQELESPAAVVVRPWQTGSRRVLIKGLLSSRRYMFVVLARDAAGNTARSELLSITTRTADPDENYDITTYAKECSERLGRLPAFNCLDGEIIKIEVNGEVPSHGYPEFAGDNNGDLDCDKPALLPMGSEGRCMPWARLGRLPSLRPDGSTHPDVDTVFICRRYNGRDGSYRWRDGQSYDALVFPGFEDVAVIQHNRVTGETCWFQMLDSAAKDARRVPPPDEERLPADAPRTALSAREFWLSPQRTAAINCLSCHDSDPWIHTPYVAQVKDREGRPVLPSHPFGPYKNLGRKYFTDWLTAGRQSFSVAPREANSCVSCHRIGSKNTCSNFAAQSIGQREAAGISAWARENFGLTTWMPPQVPGAPTSHAEWFADLGGYRSAAEKLLHCCQNPDSTECQDRTPINTAPPPFAAP
jgi:cytochrome c553